MELRFFKQHTNDSPEGEFVYRTNCDVVPHIGTDVVINDVEYIVVDIVMVYGIENYVDILVRYCDD